MEEQKKDNANKEPPHGPHGKDESGLELVASPVSAKEPERASLDDVIPSSRPQESDPPPASGGIVPKPISSNPIVIQDSLPPASGAPQSGAHASDNAPPSSTYENPMNRGHRHMPLSRIVMIGAVVFVVLVGLSLLLFR